MAYVNFKNSPSEETPLTGGATGNLNIMQENGTSHGSDTKLGYSQAFLNEHIVNVSNEVDEDYRVNVLKSINLFDKSTLVNRDMTDAVAENRRITSRQLLYLKAGTYTFKTNLNTSTYSYSLATVLSNPMPTNDYTSIYSSGYVTNLTTTFTITSQQEGYFMLTLRKIDNSALTLNAVSGFKYSLARGNTATDDDYFEPSIVVDNDEIYSKPVVLWTNPNATTNRFESQIITLNDDINNYKYYEIIFRTAINENSFSSVKIPVGNYAKMETMIGFAFLRLVNSLSGTSLGFTDCVYYSSYGGSNTTVSNNAIIPYQVIGYK